MCDTRVCAARHSTQLAVHQQAGDLLPVVRYEKARELTME